MEPGASEGTVDVEEWNHVSEAVPTVVTVGWAIDGLDADEVYVEFGPDTTYGMKAPVNESRGGSYEAVLLGLKPSSEAHYRLVLTVGDQRYVSADRSVQTGPRPSYLPEVTLGEIDADRALEGYLLTSLSSPPTAAVILDRDGDYVWWAPGPKEANLITRARLLDDGRGVLYLAEIGGMQSHGFVRVALDGSVESEVLLDDAHHDFVILPDGTVAHLRLDPRDVDGLEVLGDRIALLDADGGEGTAWSAWDAMEPPPEIAATDGDWTHANALALSPDGDAYVVSLRNLDTVLAVDRAGGGERWRLGGGAGGLEIVGAGRPFEAQHHAQILGADEGLLVFDNGLPERADSRVVEYALDPAAGTARQVWQTHLDPPVYCAAQGDARRLDDGTTLITWSMQGQIDQVSRDHELLWRVNLELGHTLGYTTLLDSLYPDDGVAP